MFKHYTKLCFLTRFSKGSLFSIKYLHLSSQCLAKEELQSMDNKHGNRIDEVLGKYNPEQEKNILKMLNNYNLNELLNYEISKARANKLLAWRTRNGLFKNLNNIFSIEGFGVKIADKFYQSLLLEPKINNVDIGKGGKAKTAPFITPSMEAKQITAIKSCVSVRVGVNSITWARLDVPTKDINSPCLLTHWQNHEISEKKLHISEIIQRCLYVHHLIPTADCYIFENPQVVQASNNPGSVEQQNINIQKAQIIAIMGYALAGRNKQLKELEYTANDKKFQYLPNVFYVKRFLTARLFNHLVGTERVSSEQTVLNMMRTYYNTNEISDFVPDSVEDDQQLIEEVNFSGRVQFPLELRQMFSNTLRYYREFLGQTLLLNLAFVRLVLREDAESIATVTGRNKTKTSSNDTF